jgi:hypothetical protein
MRQSRPSASSDIAARHERHRRGFFVIVDVQPPQPALAEAADLPRDSRQYPRGDVNRRLRLACLSGAEEWSQIIDGRGLTDEEEREAVGDCPDDLAAEP